MTQQTRVMATEPEIPTTHEARMLELMVGKRMYGRQILGEYQAKGLGEGRWSGAVYKTLRRLERKDFVAISPRREGEKSSTGGNVRKYFVVTNYGYEALEAFDSLRATMLHPNALHEVKIGGESFHGNVV